LQIALQTGELEVVAPIAGSPAEKQRIRSHDRVQINGISTAEITLDDCGADAWCDW